MFMVQARWPMAWAALVNATNEGRWNKCANFEFRDARAYLVKMRRKRCRPMSSEIEALSVCFGGLILCERPMLASRVPATEASEVIGSEE